MVVDDVGEELALVGTVGTEDDAGIGLDDVEGFRQPAMTPLPERRFEAVVGLPHRVDGLPEDLVCDPRSVIRTVDLRKSESCFFCTTYMDNALSARNR